MWADCAGTARLGFSAHTAQPAAAKARRHVLRGVDCVCALPSNVPPTHPPAVSCACLLLPGADQAPGGGSRLGLDVRARRDQLPRQASARFRTPLAPVATPPSSRSPSEPLWQVRHRNACSPSSPRPQVPGPAGRPVAARQLPGASVFRPASCRACTPLGTAQLTRAAPRLSSESIPPAPAKRGTRRVGRWGGRHTRACGMALRAAVRVKPAQESERERVRPGTGKDLQKEKEQWRMACDEVRGPLPSLPHDFRPLPASLVLKLGAGGPRDTCSLLCFSTRRCL